MSTQPPQGGWQWCTDCGSCVIPQCKEGECEWSGMGAVLLWILCMLVIGISFVSVAVVTACCGTQILGNALGMLARKRIIIVAAFSCALIAQIYAQLLELYEFKPRYSYPPAPALIPTPPCADTKITLGMWSSGRAYGDTSSFLAPCTSELHQLQAAAWFSILASVLTFVAILAAFVVERFWIFFGISISATFFQMLALALGASLGGKSDFCGSGHSLLNLGFSTDSGLGALIAAMVFLVIGGVVFPLIGKVAGWCDVDPAHRGPIYGTVVVPQYVDGDAQWQYSPQQQQSDATPVVYAAPMKYA